MCIRDRGTGSVSTGSNSFAIPSSTNSTNGSNTGGVSTNNDSNAAIVNIDHSSSSMTSSVVVPPSPKKASSSLPPMPIITGRGSGESIASNTSTTKRRFPSFRSRRLLRNKEKDIEEEIKMMFQPATTPTNTTELLHDVADNDIEIATAAVTSTVIPFDDDKTEYADCDDSIEEKESNGHENENENENEKTITAPSSIRTSPIEERSGFEVPQNVKMTRIEI